MEKFFSEAELISTGDELLNGRTINQHAWSLSRQLQSIGIKLSRDTTIPDSERLLCEVLQDALRRVDLVFISGGLGPTCDDITRQALAGLLGLELIVDQPSLERVRRMYALRGIACTSSHEQQAVVVAGATALANSVGAAPGERIEWQGKTIFLLPGPPREFGAILTEEIIPWLSARSANRPATEKIFQVCGVAESAIVNLFEKNNFPPAGLDVAYCASPGAVEIRFYPGKNSPASFEAVVERARQLLGANIFAEGRLSMEEVVGSLLLQRKETLAAAESCTGGLLGHRITNVSGSSGYYLGGVVAYANEAKECLLGVDPKAIADFGAVSAPVAAQMAIGARRVLGSDHALSITGIAGPTGGSDQKPVGLTFIGFASNRQKEALVSEYRFGGPREMVKELATQAAMDLLRRQLLS